LLTFEFAAGNLMQACRELTTERHAAPFKGAILTPRNAKNIARHGSPRSSEYSTAVTIQAMTADCGKPKKETRFWLEHPLCFRRKYAL
jgi:hypothetical protein